MANCTKFTAQKKDAFLRLLAEGNSVGEAAAAIGVTRRTAYNWRADDAAFRQDWDEATETSIEKIESVLYKKAVGGDLLACIFLLKARRPEIYNRKQVVAVGGDPDSPPIAVTAQAQRTGPVFILPHNGREPIPEHMRAPPGYAPPEIEGKAEPESDQEDVA
jgi:hypothetical protein